MTGPDGAVHDPVAQTAARMRALGLDHDVFDPAATWADLAARIEQSASLDTLLADRRELDPTAFDPSWPDPGWPDGAAEDPRDKRPTG